LYNPNFNYTEFGTIKNEAGSNNFVLYVNNWKEATFFNTNYNQINLGLKSVLQIRKKVVSLPTKFKNEPD
jgi:hypothetical protein